MIDLFITTFNRKEMFKESFMSLLKNTDMSKVRLTVVVDGSALDNNSSLLQENCDHILLHKDNLGLGPSINQALCHIQTLNNYYEDNKSKFICYCQDDVLYTPMWLNKLVKMHQLYSKKYNLAFISGHNAPEHPVSKKIKFGKQTLYLKDSIRATNMFAETDYFLSMFPISRYDPETRRERAKPNNGIGSSVDWWFMRNHPNSTQRKKKNNLVFPGLISHIGYNKSTWLDRELEEDDR